MDGFELCSRIHQTDLNQNTPVVFVTSHSDFNSRAKSTVIGGQDLIGKPFLAFELTVKALTLVFRARLDSAAAKPAKRTGPRAASPAIAAFERRGVLGSQRPPTQKDTQTDSRQEPLRAEAPASAIPSSSPPAATAPITHHASRITHHPSAHLGELRNRLQAGIQTPPADLEKFLADLCAGVHKLNEEAERAELRTVYRLGFTLEGMLKKLLEKPALRTTPSALNAAAAALELLEQLCRNGFASNLSEPPLQLLVVDDDPIARRAVCGALQLAFGRPDGADSGEAALALATEKAYDLVFMDVLMPGMDGFTSCSKIHETTPNSQTPVVFVTSHQEPDARARAEAAGGCCFIPKPVLSSEIMLTALTFILRARLEQSQTPKRTEDAAEAVC